MDAMGESELHTILGNSYLPMLDQQSILDQHQHPIPWQSISNQRSLLRLHWIT
jgi:hypothetical protein